MARHADEPAHEKAPVVRAKESFVHMWEGVPREFKFGTTVRVGHRILDGIEHLFEPFTPDYETDVKPDFEVRPVRGEKPEFESATAAPGEKRGG